MPAPHPGRGSAGSVRRSHGHNNRLRFPPPRPDLGSADLSGARPSRTPSRCHAPPARVPRVFVSMVRLFLPEVIGSQQLPVEVTGALEPHQSFAPRIGIAHRLLPPRSRRCGLTSPSTHSAPSRLHVRRTHPEHASMAYGTLGGFFPQTVSTSRCRSRGRTRQYDHPLRRRTCWLDAYHSGTGIRDIRRTAQSGVVRCPSGGTARVRSGSHRCADVLHGVALTRDSVDARNRAIGAQRDEARPSGVRIGRASREGISRPGTERRGRAVAAHLRSRERCHRRQLARFDRTRTGRCRSCRRRPGRRGPGMAA